MTSTHATADEEHLAGALPFDSLVQALRRAASALERGDIPYAVGGSVAAWARGGPEVTHDLDIFVVEGDADAAREALTEEGLRIERSPETWLFKAWDGDIPLDVIFRPVGLEVDRDLLAAAERAPVAGMTLPLLALEDVLATKLLAFNDHYLEYVHMIAIARAVREQVEWDVVRERVAQSPYARAFIFLLEELEVIEKR